MTTYKIRPLNWICYRRGSFVEHVAFGAFDTVYSIARSKEQHLLRIDSYGTLVEEAALSKDYEALKKQAEQHNIDSLVENWLKPTDDEDVYEVKPLQWRAMGIEGKRYKASGIDVNIEISILYYLNPPTDDYPFYTLVAEGTVPEAGFEPIKFEAELGHSVKKRAHQHHKEMLLKYFLYENLEWESCDSRYTVAKASASTASGYAVWDKNGLSKSYTAVVYGSVANDYVLYEKSFKSIEEAKDFCFQYHNHLLGLPQ